MKSRLFSIFVILIFAGLLVIAYFMRFPYNITTRGMIMPAKEWRLTKTGDGTLSSVFIDNLHNSTTHFSVTEFQRGDLAEFSLNPTLLQRSSVKIGDTIGLIKSSEEERRLVDLMADLMVQQSLLGVYTSGEKPEAVQMAYDAMKKAEFEYETQKKQTARNEILFNEGVIAAGEFELSQNAYLVKKQNLNIELANYRAVTTGAKQEQINFIKSNISALELRIDDVQQRLRSFTVLSPIDGEIMGRRSSSINNETIVSITDNSLYITILPVEVFQLAFIEPGQEVTLKMGSYGISFKAHITGIDNMVQMIDQRQKVFVTAVLEPFEHSIMAGMIADATISCGNITGGEYLRRLFRIVYAH